VPGPQNKHHQLTAAPARLKPQHSRISSINPRFLKGKRNSIAECSTWVEYSRVASSRAARRSWIRTPGALSVYQALQHSFTSETQDKKQPKKQGADVNQVTNQAAIIQATKEILSAPICRRLNKSQVLPPPDWAYPAERAKKERWKSVSKAAKASAYGRLFKFANALGKTTKGPSLLAKRILGWCGHKAELLHALELIHAKGHLPSLPSPPSSLRAQNQELQNLFNFLLHD